MSMTSASHHPMAQMFKLKLQVLCTMHDEHVLTYRSDGVGPPIEIGSRPCPPKDSSKIELPVLVEMNSSDFLHCRMAMYRNTLCYIQPNIDAPLSFTRHQDRG